MFSRKTLFVIGAGCSHEYELPIGDGLKLGIANRLAQLAQATLDSSIEPDVAMLDAIDHLAGRESAAWISLAGQMSRGVRHAQSIDRYLDFRQDDERVVWLGKLAIVRSILKAEQHSSLMVRSNKDVLQYDHITRRAPDGTHWLGGLFHQMHHGVNRRDSISDIFNNITFITFNYDRCIEHYLFHAVKDFAGLSPQETGAAMSGLRIYHPYGKVGWLPWQEAPAGSHKVQFGWDSSHGEELKILAESIKTFTERVEEGTELEQMRSAIREADQIVFAGFSYLEENMKLLTPASMCQATEVLSTVYLESDANCQIALELTRALLKGSSPGPAAPNIVRQVNATAGRFLKDWGNHLRRS